jgi:hypothetical protein
MARRRLKRACEPAEVSRPGLLSARRLRPPVPATHPGRRTCGFGGCRVQTPAGRTASGLGARGRGREFTSCAERHACLSAAHGRGARHRTLLRSKASSTLTTWAFKWSRPRLEAGTPPKWLSAGRRHASRCAGATQGIAPPAELRTRFEKDARHRGKVPIQHPRRTWAAPQKDTCAVIRADSTCSLTAPHACSSSAKMC